MKTRMLIPSRRLPAGAQDIAPQPVPVRQQEGEEPGPAATAGLELQYEF